MKQLVWPSSCCHQRRFLALSCWPCFLFHWEKYRQEERTSTGCHYYISKSTHFCPQILHLFSCHCGWTAIASTQDKLSTFALELISLSLLEDITLAIASVFSITISPLFTRSFPQCQTCTHFHGCYNFSCVTFLLPLRFSAALDSKLSESL